MAPAALCVILLLTTCQTLMSGIREPVVSLHSVDLAGINFTETELLCMVRVENPNAFDIPFPEIGWELYINSNFFVSGVVRNNQNIRARDSTLIEIPVNLNYLDIINTFTSLKGRRETDYKIALTANFSIPVIRDMVWHFENEGSFPLPQVPRLSSPSMRIDRADLTGVQILVSVNIENPNVFILPTPKIAFDFSVNRNSFLNSAMEARGPLAASSVTPLSFRFSVRPADLIRRFPNIQNLREVPTMLSLTIDYAIPAFGGETFNVQIPGTLPLR